METETKLKTLAAQMDLEPAEERRRPATAGPPLPCGASTPPRPSTSKRAALGIFDAVAGGKRVPLLKTLLTSACERNCYYCPFRAGRRYRRATFTPEEMAATFIQMHETGMVEGLFLSSGIVGGGIRTQDSLIATAEILREKAGYRGYLHLKIMPGAERAQVERTMELADRVSINLEAPTAGRLAQLAPRKEFHQELLRPLLWVEDVRRTRSARSAWNHRWPSSTTQFVAGGAGESDLELLSATEYLYREARVRRAYYSAFRPIVDTPLENMPAENPLRERRLYQASFLLREYGFDLEELPFTPDGNLPVRKDPKLAWAEQFLRDAPVELNRADRHQLLRVPGIGPKSAERILAARRHRTLRDVTDLQRLGVNAKRTAPYVLLDGTRPPRQLSLL